MRMDKGQFLSCPLAPTIGRNGFARVRFLLLRSVPAGASCSLAGHVDEFPEMAIRFEAGLDEVLRSSSIYFEVGLLFDGLGHPCKMEDLFYPLHGLSQGSLVAAISGGNLNRKALQPFEIALLSQEAADLDSSLNKGFCQMAPDKSRRSRDQRLQSIVFLSNP